MTEKNVGRRNALGVIPGPLRVNSGGGSGVKPGPIAVHGNAGKGIIQKPLSAQLPKKKGNAEETFNIFVATIFGEAGLSSETAWKAIGHVILNRVGYGQWRKYTTVEDIIKKTRFDAYQKRDYIIAYNYLTSKSPKKPNTRLNRMVEVLTPVFDKKEADFTSRAIMYYSPEAQKSLHKSYPKLYKEVPPWTKSNTLEQVTIPGLSATDDFKFYKYSKKTAEMYEKIAKRPKRRVKKKKRH